MIRVNDKWEVAWRPGLTIQNLLQELAFTHQYVVVSVNDTLVRPEDYSTCALQEEDRVRVIHVIGGG